MIRSLLRVCAAAVALNTLVAFAGPAHAADWPHWRGPQFNGSTDATDLPVTFSKTEGVKWTAAMPGPSASTPIVVGDYVFISSTEPSAEKLWAIALDRATGQVKWKHAVGSGYQRDGRSNYASPSAACDGERVVFFYGTGDLVAFTMDGEQLWAKNLQADYGEFSFLWTFSSSPTLYDGRLYMQILQRDEPVKGEGREGAESYVLAFDPATGKELWKVVRPSKAQSESLEAFSTPIPYEGAGRKEILIAGGDALTGHDPATGKELWRWGTWNPRRITHWRLVPSPVAGGGVVVACAPKGDPIYAVKHGAEGEGELLWKSEGERDVSSDVSTPAFHDGDLFVLNGERKAISRVDAATGKIKWTTDRLTRSLIRASPTLADGKVYFIDHIGEVFVIDASDGKVLHQTVLADDDANYIRSSVAVAGSNLFIRTDKHLYCIGK